MLINNDTYQRETTLKVQPNWISNMEEIVYRMPKAVVSAMSVLYDSHSTEIIYV